MTQPPQSGSGRVASGSPDGSGPQAPVEGWATGPKGSSVRGMSGDPEAVPSTPPATPGQRAVAQEQPTSRMSAAQHRGEGATGGVARAHSGGASGEAAPMVSPTQRRGPMQSVVVLRRIDPWSAFTTVLGLMFALYLVWMVAVGAVYLLLSGMGVWDRLGGLLSGVAGDGSADAIGASTIFLYAGGVGLLNVLLLSVLAALAVFIYNLAAGLTGGGVQVTLADRRR